MPFQFTDNGLSQSLDISLSLTNNAGQEYANSDDLIWFDFFTITVNQLDLYLKEHHTMLAYELTSRYLFQETQQ